MKKYLLLIIISCILLMPGVVNAKEYKFKIGPNGDYNVNTLDQLQEKLYELEDEDYQDEKLDYKYIFEFEDGNYDFNEYCFDVENESEYIFGKGIYKIDINMTERVNDISIKGKGLNNTKLIMDYFEASEAYFSLNIEDVSIDTNNAELYVEGYKNEERDSNIIKFEFKNVIINVLDDDDFFAGLYGEDIIPDLIFDNVKIIGAKYVKFAIYNNENLVALKERKYFQIKNSDISDTYLIFFSEDGKYKENQTLYIENSKLKNIYSMGLEVNVDCNTTFVKGINRGKGGLDDGEEALRSYNIYEYQDELYPEYNGKILLSTCKKKEIKITDKVSLEDLNKELGLNIDDTWIIDPEGIVEIKNNELVPLKIGEADLIKELDKDIYKVRVVVVPDENRVIINPKTNTPIIVFISLLTILFSTIILINIRSMRKS